MRVLLHPPTYPLLPHHPSIPLHWGPLVLPLTPPLGACAQSHGWLRASEHPYLYWSGSGRASQETADQAPVSKHFLTSAIVSGFGDTRYMGCITRWGRLWIAFPSVSAQHFVPVPPPVSILFLFLRRTEASKLGSFVFLSFIWSVSCIMGVPSFWASIQLSMSTYHVWFCMTRLPHSG